jgi:hypothetical protein
MDEQAVREHAEALCDALVAGDVDRATQDFSDELRHNLGEVIALLPLPATAATIDSLEASFSGGYTIALRVASDAEEIMIQTRWKDRADRPTIVEVSHLSRAAIAAQSEEGAAESDGPADAETANSG